jgi:PilZ domain
MVRDEQRYDCSPERALIQTETGADLIATVRDVSRSGMRIELDAMLVAGQKATVRLPRIILNGTVRYCRSQSPGRFGVGIAIEQVRDTDSSDGHI